MKIKIQMPQGLEDITLREYQKYDRVLNTNVDDKNSERFIQVKMVEIFCGITYEQAAAMTLNDFNRVVTELTDILLQEPKLVRTFQLGQTTFGFVPDLENITFGEYIDLDNFIGKVDELHKAMSVLYRPVTQQRGEKYTIQEYKGDLLHEVMLDMPMDAVVSSMLFFYNLGIELSSVMMNYTTDPELAKHRQQLEALAKSGVGTRVYTNWHKEILGDLMK